MTDNDIAQTDRDTLHAAFAKAEVHHDRLSDAVHALMFHTVQRLTPGAPEFTAADYNRLPLNQIVGLAEYYLDHKPVTDSEANPLALFGRCLQAQDDLRKLLDSTVGRLDPQTALGPDGEPIQQVSDDVMAVVERHENAADMKLLMVATALGDVINEVVSKRTQKDQA